MSDPQTDPAVHRALPEGSCPATIVRGKYRAGSGYRRIEVRIAEAQVVVTLAGGTHRIELWRLMTSLLGAAADQIVAAPGPRPPHRDGDGRQP